MLQKHFEERKKHEKDEQAEIEGELKKMEAALGKSTIMQQFDDGLLTLEALEEQLGESLGDDKDKSGCSDDESSPRNHRSQAQND